MNERAKNHMARQLAEINEGKSRPAHIRRFCPECGEFETWYHVPDSFSPRPGGMVEGLSCPLKADQGKWHRENELTGNGLSLDI